MKRLIPIFLSLLLLAACSDKAAPSSSQKDPSSGGGLVISPPENSPSDPHPSEDMDVPSNSAPDESQDFPSGDDSSPQVDVALIREIIFTYGAEEDIYNYDQPTIVMKKKSLFIRDESWSGENGLTPFDYLYWEDSRPTTDEEWDAIEAGQHYAEGRQGESPFGYRYLGPGEMVEEKILSHFQVTLEHLRSDPEYYDGSIPGYFMMAGGGMGARPTISFTFQQDGDILTVPVTLTFPDGSEPETTHTLTIRLESNGGWKYLGCQVG